MTGTPSEASPTAQSPKRARSIVLVIVWIAVLAILVVTSANPVTLNVVQIDDAAKNGAILAVTVLDPRQGSCHVEEVLAGRADLVAALKSGDSIRIANLQSTQAKAGEAYLVPAIRTGDNYYIAPTPLPDQPRLIYPDSVKTRAMVHDLLNRLPPAK